MFDTTSRYYKLETATLETAEEGGGTREIRYVRRRFIPDAEASAAAQEHTVTDGERPDTITARYLGDPTRFWQICDANNAMRPEELTEEAGKRIIIPIPGI